MTTLAIIRRNALRSLIPPPRIALSEWIEANIKLPEGVSALPCAIRLYPYQREIADAISDPEIERVTMAKAARLGFTTLLSATRARANQRKTFDGLRVEFLHSPPALGCNKVIGARTNTSTLNDLSWRRKYHVQHSVNKTSLNRFNSP